MSDSLSTDDATVDVESVIASFASSLANADAKTEPFRHWLPCDLWPWPLVRSLENPGIDMALAKYQLGRREENNALRVFFDREHQETLEEWRLLAAALQDPRTIGALQKCCDVDLTGSYLRIEYAHDTEGFWLGPHTDIGVKRFTMQVGLSGDANAHSWGTDLYANPDQHAARIPFGANRALIFVPGDNTWHGFEKRPMDGIRKSLIVNFVSNEWRNRNELCFPDCPIG